MRCPLAICDARYVFALVDIGSYGSNNESGVFRNSTMGKGFFENCMNLPDPEVISNDCSRKELPYYLVGDEAFPTQPWYGLILEKIFMKKMQYLITVYPGPV